MSKNYKSDLMAAIHEMAVPLHEVGIMDQKMVWVADRPSHSIHYDNEGVLSPQ